MLKRSFFFLFWVTVFCLALYQARSSKPISHFMKSHFSHTSFQAKTAVPSPKPVPAAKAATLYLKNGGVLSGELLQETDQGVTLFWQGGEVAFKKQEIEKIQKGEYHAEKEGLVFPEASPERWSYENAVVIHLKDQRILDEEISNVQTNTITLRRKLEEGGMIEQEIDRSQIEYLSFKPVVNEKSRKIEETLRTQFPKMKWVREGAFTLVTDSYTTWVNEYRKAIRDLGTDFYFTFFPLVRGREPKVGHYVVIFDEWKDFIEYAATDGVPGWAVAGYFSPKSEVLFLFNTLGDSFSSLIDEAIMGRAGRVMDQAVDAVKGQVDKRYHVFVEGQAHDVMKKFATYQSVLRGYYRQQTIEALRHEMTHELFHNFGLQSVVVSKLGDPDVKEAEKKRTFLDEKDVQKKRGLLLELAQLKRSGQPIQVEASNSWFVEGLATYMQSSPVGAENKRWLYNFQEARRKNILFPLEHLTVYKMGSFPGISYEAMQYAYAQSWALVYFLMHRYPEPFMKYLERISREKPKESEDIFWLLSALGKELRVVEGEFLDYMNQFPETEDPFLEEFDTMRRIFQG